MTGNEFIRRIRRLGRQRGFKAEFVPEHGKGSHETLYFGDRLATVRNPRDKWKARTLHAMLPQLGLARPDPWEARSMRNFIYPALLTLEEQDGRFVVTFPDVPEAITQGGDVSDALQQAADCLEEAIAGRIRRQACLPGASPERPNSYPVPLPAQTAAKAALYLAIRQTGMTPGEIAPRLHCDENRPCGAQRSSFPPPDRHSRESGNPLPRKNPVSSTRQALDSRFRGSDGLGFHGS